MNESISDTEQVKHDARQELARAHTFVAQTKGKQANFISLRAAIAVVDHDLAETVSYSDSLMQLKLFSGTFINFKETYMVTCIGSLEINITSRFERQNPRL